VSKLHIDTDIGGDIDDFCALAMALQWPAELVGVTTVAEHRGKRAGFARYVLKLAGRDDVPVAAGAEASLERDRVWQGLPDESVYWPEPIESCPGPIDRALDLLERNIDEGATVVTIGALANLALLEQRSPGVLRRARLFTMGGYVFPPREGFPAWRHEFDFNVQVDAPSAQLVIQHSNPTFIPLAMTAETFLRRAYLPVLEKAGPVARLIARQAEAYATEQKYESLYGKTCSGLPDDTINFLHDPLAVAIALGWNDGVEIKEFPLKTEIKDGWLCHSIYEGGNRTRVVTRIDGQKFSEFWLETVAR
jgi:inosine-uridine nucleoside N-ribohydrolase